ncbi:MAG: flagellar hook assembly protein FlgD [Desulfobacterales bacterium]
MDINAIDRNIAAQTAASAGSTAGTLGKDDFLKLMVAQLKHQDPLDPVDTSQFITQTAQFSSLEQLINVNSNLEALLAYQSNLNNSAAVGYMGKEVSANGNSIFYENGEASDLVFSLDAEAAETYINIYDAQGGYVATLEPGALAAGEHRLAWDGTDNQGNPLPEGVYAYTVDAVSAEGGLIQASSFVEGLVSGVHYLGGKPYLMVNEQLVPLTAVTHIHTPEDEGELE